MTTSRARNSWLIGLAIVCVGAFVARLMSGESFGWLDADLPNRDSILGLRITAACVALIVGANLAVSGVYLQTLLRNPLASPFILGLAGGAGFGVMAALTAYRIAYPSEAVSPWWLKECGALVGALVSLVLVYSLSRRRGIIDPLTLLLVGVVVNFMAGAGIMLMQYLAPARDIDAVVRWMMGHLDELTPASSLIVVSTISIVCIGYGLMSSRALDAASLGDDEARSVGVGLDRIRTLLLLASGVLTACAVFMAGPIGFIGLIAPHIARLVVGARHARLIVGSALLGAFLLLIADVGVSLAPRHYGRPPVGILTTAIGGPMFIWLLLRERSTLQ